MIKYKKDEGEEAATRGGREMDAKWTRNTGYFRLCF